MITADVSKADKMKCIDCFMSIPFELIGKQRQVANAYFSDNNSSQDINVILLFMDRRRNLGFHLSCMKGFGNIMKLLTTPLSTKQVWCF